MQADLLIMGGGPVGVTLARALADIDLTLVLATAAPPPDTPPLPLTEDPRAYALSPASRQLLEGVNAWPEARACPYRGMHVRDRNGTGQVRFQAENCGLTELGHILGHQDLMEVLQQGLRQQDNLRIITGKPLESLTHDASGQINVRFNDCELQVKLVVGCDGQSSIVRQLARIPVHTWNCRQTALAFAAQFEKPHEFIARQVFLDHGPVAMLPLKDNSESWCIVIWSADNSIISHLRQSDDTALGDALFEATEGLLGRTRKIGVRKYFPLYQRLARTWIKTGIVLAGDAAHSIHPLAGQGLNLGLADVRALADLLRCRPSSGASQSARSIGDKKFLVPYQRRRLPVALGTITLMETFRSGFQAEEPTLRWLRNAALNLCDRNEIIKSRIVTMASGLHGY